MKAPVINVADVSVHAGKSGEYFEFTMLELGDDAGARATGGAHHIEPKRTGRVYRARGLHRRVPAQQQDAGSGI
jgi:hypothetical protein